MTTTMTMNSEELERRLYALLEDHVKVLVEKNRSYGNSVFDPIHVFAEGDAVALLKVQIDHKLSRIARGDKTYDEDTLGDLIRYLLLLQIAEQDKAKGADEKA